MADFQKTENQFVEHTRISEVSGAMRSNSRSFNGFEVWMKHASTLSYSTHTNTVDNGYLMAQQR